MGGSYYSVTYPVADPGEGPGKPTLPPPLLIDQTEARRAEKIFFGDRPPSPYLRVWMDAFPRPSYLKVWIKYWYRWSYGSLVPKVFETGLGSLELDTSMPLSWRTGAGPGDTNPMTIVTWSYKG